MVFGVVPRKTISCVPGKLVNLHHTCPPVKTIIYQEKWFIFIILLFIVPASLSCSLSFVPVET